ncbi:hypothetical protein AB0C34_17585 [Nocardia sp. NPDC049220]
MAWLLDLDGPFEYCSQRGGHKPLLTPLPTDPLPAVPRPIRAAS